MYSQSYLNIIKQVKEQMKYNKKKKKRVQVPNSQDKSLSRASHNKYNKKVIKLIQLQSK